MAHGSTAKSIPPVTKVTRNWVNGENVIKMTAALMAPIAVNRNRKAATYVPSAPIAKIPPVTINCAHEIPKSNLKNASAA